MSRAIDAAYAAWDAYKPTPQDVSGHGAMEAALLAAVCAIRSSVVAAISANVSVREGQTVIDGPGALADILSAISDDTQVGTKAACRRSESQTPVHIPERAR